MKIKQQINHGAWHALAPLQLGGKRLCSGGIRNFYFCGMGVHFLGGVGESIFGIANLNKKLKHFFSKVLKFFALC